MWRLAPWVIVFAVIVVAMVYTPFSIMATPVLVTLIALGVPGWFAIWAAWLITAYVTTTAIHFLVNKW